jgi:hypothetical protein
VATTSAAHASQTNTQEPPRNNYEQLQTGQPKQRNGLYLHTRDSRLARCAANESQPKTPEASPRMVQTHPTVQTTPNQTMPRKKLKRRTKLRFTLLVNQPSVPKAHNATIHKIQDA